MKLADPNEFEVGSYVVFLSLGNKEIPYKPGEALPTGYCYKLSRPYKNGDQFFPVLDMKGLDWNGYSSSTNKKVLRRATDQEIQKYIELGKPYDISTLPKLDQVINNYQIY